MEVRILLVTPTKTTSTDPDKDLTTWTVGNRSIKTKPLPRAPKSHLMMITLYLGKKELKLGVCGQVETWSV